MYFHRLKMKLQIYHKINDFYFFLHSWNPLSNSFIRTESTTACLSLYLFLTAKSHPYPNIPLRFHLPSMQYSKGFSHHEFPSRDNNVLSSVGNPPSQRATWCKTTSGYFSHPCSTPPSQRMLHPAPLPLAPIAAGSHISLPGPAHLSSMRTAGEPHAMG